jgi:hypothetical protein
MRHIAVTYEAYAELPPKATHTTETPMPGLSALRAQIPGIVGLAVPITAGLAAGTLLGVTDAEMLVPLGPVPLSAVGAVLVVRFLRRTAAAPLAT